MKIYLVHPINGLSYDDVVKYYDETTKELRDVGYTVLSPMTGKLELRTEIKFKAQGYDNIPASTNHAIKERDKWMVKQCDVLYGNLENSKIVSIGSVAEFAWGDVYNKHTIATIPKGNIHEHAFMLECADIVFQKHIDSMIYLKKLIAGRT